MRQTNLVGQKLAGFVALIRHRAELVHLENFLVLPRPLLTENDRTAQLDAHQYRHDEQYRRKYDERAAGEKNIQQPFGVTGVNALLPLFHADNFLSQCFFRCLLYAKHVLTSSMTISCWSGVILLSLGRHSPRWKMSAPTSATPPAI